MAQITITSTAAQDSAIKRATDTYNASQSVSVPGWVNVSPKEWAMTNVIIPALDALVRQFITIDGETKGELYQKASDADKAAIDTILAKYAGA